MAVYLVSVKRFAGARRSLATPASPPVLVESPVIPALPDPPSSALPSSDQPTALAVDVPIAESVDGTQPTAATIRATETQPAAESVSMAESGGGARAELSAQLSASVEELLRLPREQVSALLADCGETTSKVLLALIYRLSAVEGELNELATTLRGGAVRALQPAMTRAPGRKSAPAEKSEVLEQLFQKNMQLRKGR